MAGEKDKKKGEGIALSLATGYILLKNRKYRRNALFFSTALCLFMVFGGIVFLGDALMKRPVGFIVFWGICLLLVIFVFWLAIYDMAAIRREHRFRMELLDDELEQAAEEARVLAEKALKEDEARSDEVSKNPDLDP